MRITVERGRFVAAAVMLAAGFSLAGSGPAAQQGTAAANWPQFRGPNRDGKSADTNLLKQWDADGPALVWKTSGLGTGYSSLSIGGDRLFTMGDLDGSQHVDRALRDRRQAAVEGQGRADLAGPTTPGRAARRPSTARCSTRSAPTATSSASRPRPARSAGARTCRATSAAR